MATPTNNADLAPPRRSGLNKVPPELRTMVWRLLPGPREIRIWRAFDNNSRLPYLKIATETVQPITLSICKESRAEALRNYAIMVGPNKFCIAIDPSRDTIVFRSDNFSSQPLPRILVELGRECKFAEWNVLPVAGGATISSLNGGRVKVVFADLAPRFGVKGRRADPPKSGSVNLTSCFVDVPNLGADLATILRPSWTRYDLHCVPPTADGAGGMMITWEEQSVACTRVIVGHHDFEGIVPPLYRLSRRACLNFEEGEDNEDEILTRLPKVASAWASMSDSSEG